MSDSVTTCAGLLESAIHTIQCLFQDCPETEHDGQDREITVSTWQGHGDQALQCLASDYAVHRATHSWSHRSLDSYRQVLATLKLSSTKSVTETCALPGIEIPWIPSNHGTPNPETEKLHAHIRAQIDRIKGSLLVQGLKAGSIGYNRQLARELFTYLSQPTDQGGFGLSFDTTPGMPRNLAEIYRDRQAVCIEFVTLFLLVADIAGLPIVPLELIQDSASQTQLHVAVGIVNPTTQNVEILIDLETPGYFGTPPTTDTWIPLSRQQFLAYYYNARGVHEPNQTLAESYIDIALCLFPDNYLILFNKAYYDALRGDLQTARDSLSMSITANPNYVRSYWNLHQIARQLGDTQLADWALQRYNAQIPPTH